MNLNINKHLVFLRKKFYALPRQWQILFLLSAFALLSIMSFYIYNANTKHQIDNSSSDAVSAQTDAFEAQKDDNIPSYYIRRSLDGVYVDPAQANLYPIAVMVDNDPNARPQAGLAHAQLVYEAKAEGGITRFMAVFADGEDLPAIGPIRSARPYYIDWARGLGALYVHVGGSPQALDILDKISLFDINEFYQGKYFWRSNKKDPPHNVYSNYKNFSTYLDKLNASNRGYDAWLYKDEALPDKRGDNSITIDYSVDDFLVEWTYNKDSNEYIRHMGGIMHKDADGTQIKAKNIVIMQVAAKVIDDKLRREMSDIGEGKAWYCFDGSCQTGTWQKPDADTREKIYNTSGEEVHFNAGTTWVQVIQNEEELNISE